VSSFRWNELPEKANMVTDSFATMENRTMYQSTALPSRTTMERAYMKSDSSFDGIFCLGVRSTGIFCRPSCSARKPKPSNVEFYASPREALFAGYRPCKRCSPMAAAGELPAWAKPLFLAIEQSPDKRIKDRDIRALGIDPARARRLFKSRFGMTFQAYCRGRRLGGAFQEIRKGTGLDDVALGHGYESHSGFREAFVRTFGTPPGRSDKTGAIIVTWIESPLGPLIAGVRENALVLLEFSDRRMLEAQFTTLRRLFKSPIVPGESQLFAKLRSELNRYFSGTLKRFTIPIAYPGSPFQRKVWDGLLAIPYGATISYEELARRVGDARAQRAVGHANGLNRIGIIIPCHRVVNKSGKLGGYGGGLWRKQRLLELERSR
jgi:AraC family transcriptional regulator, regulatory protein of adaptative response / methylated-DNA-[protein]-cysteine methyltransferase